MAVELNLPRHVVDRFEKQWARRLEARQTSRTSQRILATA
jgi:hypothetical protein